MSVVYLVCLIMNIYIMNIYIFVCVCVCVRYLQTDLDAFDLRDLKCKFDVILIEPPLEEYYRESGVIANERFWNWDDVSCGKCLSKCALENN